MRTKAAPQTMDVTCIGETMVSFVETTDPTTYVATTAGAASNVAVGLARLGLATRWVSRLGDDPLGRLIEETLSDVGVDVSVVRDPSAPTGVMVKHPAGTAKVSQYYRNQSAARRLNVEDLERIGPTRWIHVTGVTPSLSSSALELTRTLHNLTESTEVKISFDFNYRSPLWEDASIAADTLLPIAREADVVFIGDDEGRMLYGSDSALSLADLLCASPDHELLLKRGSRDASCIIGDRELSVPALPASVVDVTGAGDAFAAGYLAGRIQGWDVIARIRLGHLMASRVVGSIHDVAEAFVEAELNSLSPQGLEAMWRTQREGQRTNPDERQDTLQGEGR